VDFETSLLLYYNRSGPTLMIFFMRAFFSFIIFSIKVFELDKYLMLFMTFIYRFTDFYYFIYYLYSKDTGYPKILVSFLIVFIYFQKKKIIIIINIYICVCELR